MDLKTLDFELLLGRKSLEFDSKKRFFFLIYDPETDLFTKNSQHFLESYFS